MDLTTLSLPDLRAQYIACLTQIDDGKRSIHGTVDHKSGRAWPRDPQAAAKISEGYELKRQLRAEFSRRKEDPYDRPASVKDRVQRIGMDGKLAN